MWRLHTQGVTGNMVYQCRWTVHLGNSIEHHCRIILPTTNVYHVLGLLPYASVGCMTEVAEDANTTRGRTFITWKTPSMKHHQRLKYLIIRLLSFGFNNAILNIPKFKQGALQLWAQPYIMPTLFVCPPFEFHLFWFKQGPNVAVIW